MAEVNGDFGCGAGLDRGRWRPADVAAIAAIVSYSHIYDLGRAHGGSGVAARLLPLSVDMLILVGELMLLHEADEKGKRFILGWVLVWSGILATLGANVTYGARYGLLGALIRGWPAYSFVLAAGGMVAIVKRAAARTSPGSRRKRQNRRASEVPSARCRPSSESAAEASLRATLAQPGNPWSANALGRRHRGGAAEPAAARAEEGVQGQVAAGVPAHPGQGRRGLLGGIQPADGRHPGDDRRQERDLREEPAPRQGGSLADRRRAGRGGRGRVREPVGRQPRRARPARAGVAAAARRDGGRVQGRPGRRDGPRAAGLGTRRRQQLQHRRPDGAGQEQRLPGRQPLGATLDPLAELLVHVFAYSRTSTASGRRRYVKGAEEEHQVGAAMETLADLYRLSASASR